MRFLPSLGSLEHLSDLLTAQQRSLGTRAQDWQAGERISDNAYLLWAGSVRCQHDASAMHLGIERVARPEAKLAANRNRQDNLALSGNSGFHGQTILPQPARLTLIRRRVQSAPSGPGGLRCIAASVEARSAAPGSARNAELRWAG